MDRKHLYIKNMVCPRCIRAVEGALIELDIPFQKIELGHVFLTDSLQDEASRLFASKLESLGFELLESGKAALISQIKTSIIDKIHYSENSLDVNFSEYLSDKLFHEYSYLSRLFSSVEGITIEKFIIKQKIEKVKELLFYDELSLSEIAFQMDYSSTAHLSAQFKKETGMTPSIFKKHRQPGHRNLDSI